MKQQIRLSDHFTYRKLLQFVFPSIVMMIFTSIYGVVDGLFVSNFAGKTAFAAINLVMPFIMVLGGIGSIPGAMVGGIAIGLCECFVSAIGLSAWKDAVTFAILIIVLLVKPTGFLGRKVQEKV